MSVYVSLPQIPLTLKFEETHDEVLAHFRELIETGHVHKYVFDEGQSVIVNYRVINCATISEGHRTLEVAEIHSALKATIGRQERDDDPESVET